MAAARIRRFVVGLDRSELGMVALDRAIADAAEQLAEVHVVFAYQPLGDATNLYGGPADPALDYELERLTPIVRERIEKYGPDSPNVVFHGVIGGAADALVTTAAVLDADAIYVGTHGRTGLARAFIGSVAEKVARTAGCPVIIVRERGHERSLRWPKHHREISVR
jgi:nucleotide-binding universal stress UspA family protein